MKVLWRLEFLFLCVILSFVCKAHCEFQHSDEDFATIDVLPKDWWESASFYQIYPRSFKDTNEDGIGDLNGITQQLPYLKKIGITAAWLSPIFKSPMADFGYDIADFYNIQPEYGTMADFVKMIEIAKQLDLKIFLDFVPNHSSDEHEWFINSVNREPGFENFYIWHPGYPDEKNTSHRLPPSNWVSVFRKSAWQWNEKRQEFYLHQFTVKQPDLNYRNPKVVEEMKSVLRFWLDRGVSGFRIDACPHLFEIDRDSEGKIKDEPLSGNTNDPDDYGYLNHIYTVDQPETIDMIYQWREVLDQYKAEHGGDTRVMLTESYSPLNVVQKYFGDGKRNGSHIPFNFQFINRITNDSLAYDYVACINDWMNILPPRYPANWVIGNHDKSRVGSRLGADRIDSINMLLLSLPGVSITYNGEEIGMTDQWISWKDTVDPAACNTNPSIYQYFTRDPERTPFQWNDEKNAGFSTATKTWLPVADNYKEVNVAKEKASASSHLNVYVQLQALKREPTLIDGNVTYAALNNQVIVVLRELENEATVATVVNIGPYNEAVNVKKLAPHLPDAFQYHIVSTLSTHKIGDKVSINEINLVPKESFVLRSIHPNSIDEYFSYKTKDEI